MKRSKTGVEMRHQEDTGHKSKARKKELKKVKGVERIREWTEETWTAWW